MSQAYDETYDVYDERVRRAAKPHTCCACRETIEPGHRYYVIGVVFDGSAESYKRCLKCQTTHEHLRGLAPGELWPDEKLNCGEEYTEHWGCEPPPDIARLAFMTQAEAQVELADE